MVDTGLCRELALSEQHTREGRQPGVPGAVAGSAFVWQL